MKIKTLVKIEEAGMFLTSYLSTIYLGFELWLFWALLILPDISMIGYSLNNKVGAFIYNLFHHRGMAIALVIISYSLDSKALLLSGIVLFGHIAMDRMLGYGLKFQDNFKHTHLGQLEK